MATAVRKKDKQQFIEEEMDESIPEIEQAAEEYVAIRDKRMVLTEDEVEARTRLIAKMKDHKLDFYKFDGQIVTVLHGEDKVKVKKSEVEGNTDPD